MKMTRFLNKMVVPDANRRIYWKYRVRMKPTTTIGEEDDKKLILAAKARTEVRARFLAFS